MEPRNYETCLKLSAPSTMASASSDATDAPREWDSYLKPAKAHPGPGPQHVQKCVTTNYEKKSAVQNYGLLRTALSLGAWIMSSSNSALILCNAVRPAMDGTRDRVDKSITSHPRSTRSQLGHSLTARIVVDVRLLHAVSYV